MHKNSNFAKIIKNIWEKSLQWISVKKEQVLP
jgi:hypothetical protein